MDSTTMWRSTISRLWGYWGWCKFLPCHQRAVGQPARPQRQPLGHRMLQGVLQAHIRKPLARRQMASSSHAEVPRLRCNTCRSTDHSTNQLARQEECLCTRTLRGLRCGTSVPANAICIHMRCTQIGIRSESSPYSRFAVSLYCSIITKCENCHMQTEQGTVGQA